MASSRPKGRKKKSSGNPGKPARFGRPKSGGKASFLKKYLSEPYLWGVITLLAFAVGYVYSGSLQGSTVKRIESANNRTPASKPITEKEIGPHPVPLGKKTASLVQPVSPAPSSVVAKAKRKPRIAVIIDDLGAGRKIVDRMLNIDAPLTFSILPHLKRSRELALYAGEKGRVVMLHIPMEPKSKRHNAGPGALYVAQSDIEIVEILRSDLESVPGAVGVNNHMGSLFTEDKQKTPLVLKEIKKLGLFFVDSRTTAGTVAHDSALKLGIPTTKRDVFLDNEKDKDKVIKNILALARIAIKNGSAVGIGHPFSETAAALEETLPELKRMGVEIVPVTDLLSPGK